jgi:hypothetical protein
MMVLADSVTGFKVPEGYGGPAVDGLCDWRRDTEGRCAPAKANLPPGL